MENTSSLVLIIIIVFGILQIMLFFKLWGMTNNISKIKSKLFKMDDSVQKYDMLLISEKYDQAYTILTDEITRDICKIYHLYSFNKFQYDNGFQKVIDRYKPKFEMIKKEIPEYILKCADLEYIKKLI